MSSQQCIMLVIAETASRFCSCSLFTGLSTTWTLPSKYHYRIDNTIAQIISVLIEKVHLSKLIWHIVNTWTTGYASNAQTAAEFGLGYCRRYRLLDLRRQHIFFGTEHYLSLRYRLIKRKIQWYIQRYTLIQYNVGLTFSRNSLDAAIESKNIQRWLTPSRRPSMEAR
jgi:hypothetical protein